MRIVSAAIQRHTRLVTMRLFAISDLHLHHAANAEALEQLAPHPDDALILGGDITESIAQLERTLAMLAPRWKKLFWIPGNHDLWTVTRHGETERGVARYERLIALCRSFGVHTPEDDFVVWPGAHLPHEGALWPVMIAPLFLLYDYSFAPEGMSPEAARRWAEEGGIMASDESLLHPDPYPSREAWCEARLQWSEARLIEASKTHRLVLLNHWPMRRELVRLGRVARYSPWCGTEKTRDWHKRFNAAVVVSGHIHVRATDVIDGTRFEEVSLGYPRDWDKARGMAPYLRRIL